MKGNSKDNIKRLFFFSSVVGVGFFSLSCGATAAREDALAGTLAQRQEHVWRDSTVVEVLKERLSKAEEKVAKDLVPLAKQLHVFAEGFEKSQEEVVSVAQKSNEVIGSLLFRGQAITHDPVFNFSSLNEYEQPTHSYLLAQVKLSQFEAELAELEKQQLEINEYQATLLSVKQLFERALLLHRQLLMFGHQALTKQKQVEIAEDALEAAKKNNWSFGKELALYTLGFKWLWGFFTLYAPTRFSAQQSADLAKHKQELQETLAVVSTKKQQLLPQLRQTLKEFYQKLRVASQQTSILQEQRGLLNLEVSALKVFEDLEVFEGYNWLEWLRARYTERLGAKRLDYEANRWVYNLDGFSWSPFKTNTTSQLNFYAEELQPHMAFRDLLAFQFKKSYWFYWMDPSYFVKGIPASILPPLWNVHTESPLKPHYEFIEHSSVDGAFKWKRLKNRDWVTHLGWEPGAKYLETREVPTQLFEELFSSPSQRMMALEQRRQSLEASKSFALEYMQKLRLQDLTHKLNRIDQTLFLKKIFKDANQLKVKLKNYLNSLTSQQQGFEELFEALREALVSVVESVELHKNKLILQESLLLLNELTQLREQSLNTAYLANWNIPSEVVLYLFGFKWFWGIFTGYQATPLVSTEKKQLDQTKKFAASTQKELVQKLEELNSQFETSFTKTREALFKAASLAKTGVQRIAIQRFASHFKVVFQEQELAKEKYEQAKEVFNAYRIDTGRPYSQASRVDSYFSVPGFMANFFTMGMFGQRSQAEEQKRLLEEATSETRYQVLEYKQAAEELREAQQKYETFFDPKQGLREIFELLEEIKLAKEQAAEINQTVQLATQIEAKIAAELKSRLKHDEAQLASFLAEISTQEAQLKTLSLEELTTFFAQVSLFSTPKLTLVEEEPTKEELDAPLEEETSEDAKEEAEAAEEETSEEVGEETELALEGDILLEDSELEDTDTDANTSEAQEAEEESTSLENALEELSKEESSTTEEAESDSQAEQDLEVTEEEESFAELEKETAEESAESSETSESSTSEGGDDKEEAAEEEQESEGGEDDDEVVEEGEGGAEGDSSEEIEGEEEEEEEEGEKDEKEAS